MIKLSNGLVADTSTLRIDRLKKLPIVKASRIGHNMGAGCFLDPPGYPSYFLRSYGPDSIDGYAIAVDGVAYHVRGDQVFGTEGWQKTVWKAGVPRDDQERLCWLYDPLPMGNPRVRAWIGQLHRHQRHCYRIEGEKDITIFPPQVTEWVSKGLFVAKPKVDQLPYFFQHLTPESQEKLKALMDGFVAEAEEQVKLKREQFVVAQRANCTPDRHLSTITIRKVYPDYEPELDLIAGENLPLPTDWWTVLAQKPDPCPLGHKLESRFMCQYCGERGEGTPEQIEKKATYKGYVYHNEAAKEVTA